MRSVDKTLFTLKHRNDFLLVQIYVDDINFGGSSHMLVPRFQEMMEKEFQMCMMRELTFYLGIQIKQMKHGTFVHQAKYTKDLMKKFNMAELKPVSTLMSTATALDPDENGEAVDQREYRRMISSLLYLTVTWRAFKLSHALHIGQLFNEFSGISNTHSNLGFGIPLLHHLILLAFPMLILWVVGLTKKALLVHAIFLDLLLFVGLLANNVLLHNPQQRPSM
jgi:hypothetical protein